MPVTEYRQGSEVAVTESAGTNCGLERDPRDSRGDGPATTLQPLAGHRQGCIETPGAVDTPEAGLTPLHTGPPMRGSVTITRITVIITANAHWKLSWAKH